jgi:transcriptional regulator with XRE-family HTH domain
MAITTEPRMHIGRKIERIRELRGMKQETLADLLGVSQQAVSRMESSQDVEEERLQKVATALGVTPEAIRHFSEEALFNNINSIHDNHENSVNTFHVVNYQFNPIEKIVELYERLLKSEREKVELLQSLIKKD